MNFILPTVCFQRRANARLPFIGLGSPKLALGKQI
jgi:hypothetical protein